MQTAMIRLAAVLGAGLLGWGSVALAQAPGAKYQEGVHYTAIPDAPARSGGGVEVVEAFSYMCTHCATFEPYITSWKKNIPANVEFRRIPVVFGRSAWEVYARAYVTADMMGIADPAHGALMDRIWKEKAVPKSIEELAEFYSAFGAKPSEFVATSKSFAVDARMRREQAALQTAGVRGTPSMIVNGKYLVAAGPSVGNFDVMLDVVNFLVAAESAAAPAAQAAAVPAAQD